jgi:hypothetical protein
MNTLLRSLMSSDTNTNRPLLSLILLGIFDFVCVLEAGDLYKDRKFVEGTWWLIAGVAFSVIGYYWTQIKQGLGERLAAIGHLLQAPKAEPEPIKPVRLKIISAHWGIEGLIGGDPNKVDCLLERQSGNVFAELVGLDLFHGCIPAPGKLRLKVEYSFDGRKSTVVRQDGEFLMLPEDPFLVRQLKEIEERHADETRRFELSHNHELHNSREAYRQCMEERRESAILNLEYRAKLAVFSPLQLEAIQLAKKPAAKKPAKKAAKKKAGRK